MIKPESIPAVLLIGDFPDVPKVVKLRRWSRRNRIVLVEFSGPTPSSAEVAEAIEKYRPIAIITRPTGFPKGLPADVFDCCPHKVYIGNIAMEPKYLAHLALRKNVELVLPREKANAPSVAEYTFWTALSLLRPLPETLALGQGPLVDGKSHNFHNGYPAIRDSRTLRGSEWVCLGAGRLTRYLLPLLMAVGARRATVWSPKLDDARMGTATGLLPGVSVTNTDSPWLYDLTYPGGFEVRGINNQELDAAALFDPDHSGACIVTVHVETRDPAKEQPVINAQFLAQLPPSCFVINVARGHWVEEGAVVAALLNGHLAGFAADVINAEAESKHDPQQSALWQLYRTKPTGVNFLLHPHPAILLTPHVAASTYDAIKDLTDEIVPRILIHAGFTESDAQAE